MRTWLVILLACLTATAALAGTNEKFTWSEQLADNTLTVKVEIAPAAYLYLDQTAVELTNAKQQTIPPSQRPKAVDHEVFGEKIVIFPEGVHEWVFPLDKQPPYSLKVKYQGCAKDPYVCFPPAKFEKTFGAAAATPAPDRNRLWLFWAAFFGGLLSVMSPCVLPLIPITLAALGAGKGTSRGKALSRVALYVLGMVATFTVLAVVAAFTGGTLGASLFGKPLFTLAFAVLLAALALSMFGLYELELPQSWQMRLNRVGGGSGAGAFLMGTVAGFAAIPCTGPVLAGLLVVAAASGSVVFSVGLFLTYALGFGLPFLAVGAGAAKLPKSGPYMELVKSALGMAVLTLAFFFLTMSFHQLDELFSLPTVGAKLAILTLLLAGVLLGAFHADGHSPSKLVRAMKILGAALAAFGIIWLLKLPLASPTQAWGEDVAAAFATAKAENKNVCLDYTADWCLACKELESKTFPAPEVAAELAKHWILLKVDGTVESPAVLAIKERFGLKNPPTIVLLSPEQRELGRVYGFMEPAPFLKALTSVP